MRLIKTYLITLFIGLTLSSCSVEEEPMVEASLATDLDPVIDHFRINNDDALLHNHFHHNLEDPFNFLVKFTRTTKPESHEAFILLTVNGDTSLTRVQTEMGSSSNGSTFSGRFSGSWDNLSEIVLDEDGGLYDRSNPYQLKAGDDLIMTAYVGSTDALKTAFRRITIKLEK